MSKNSTTGTSASWAQQYNQQYATQANPYQNTQKQMKGDSSSTGAPIKFDSSTASNDPTSALIGIISTNITTSMTDLKESISQVKKSADKDSKEIKEKIDSIQKTSWVDKLLEPSTVAILCVVLLILSFVLVGALKKYTGTSIADVKDYILLFGGGLVGFLGGDKIKNQEKK